MWSQKNTAKYDAAYTARQWDKYHGCPPTEITGRTVLGLADAVGLGWRREYNAKRRRDQMERNKEIGEGVDPNTLRPTVLNVEQMHDQLIWVGSVGEVINKTNGRRRRDNLAAKEYASSTVVIDGKKVKCFQVWMASGDRQQVDVVAWAPGDGLFCQPPEGDPGSTAFNTVRATPRGARRPPTGKSWWHHFWSTWHIWSQLRPRAV